MKLESIGLDFFSRPTETQFHEEEEEANPWRRRRRICNQPHEDPNPFLKNPRRKTSTTKPISQKSKPKNQKKYSQIKTQPHRCFDFNIRAVWVWFQPHRWRLVECKLSKGCEDEQIWFSGETTIWILLSLLILGEFFWCFCSFFEGIDVVCWRNRVLWTWVSYDKMLKSSSMDLI